MFAILVLMALFTTFMTTPAVMAIYKPSRRIFRLERQQSSTTEKSREKTRILACIHGPANVPSLVNFIESTGSSGRSSLKLYVLRLIELTDRSSSIIMVQRTRKNGFPYIKRFSRRGSSNDETVAAFEAYGHVSQLTIRHSTSISALSTMHEDICHLAQSKRVSMIVLLYHKQWREDENGTSGWRHVNQKVFDNAPCSVAILVDRQERTATTFPKRVCVLFFGGPDDRQAMEVGGWMAEKHAISVSLIRFYEPASNNSVEKKGDEEAVQEFRSKWNGSVEYIEKRVDNIEEEVLNIGRNMGFDLLIAGKRGTVGDPAEHPELGRIGGILASSDYNSAGSLLVIQHNNSTNFTEPKLAEDKEATNTNGLNVVNYSSV